MKILTQAESAGLTVRPVTYKGEKRKGYDLIDPVTGYVQYTLVPVSYPITSTYAKDKWVIDSKGNGVKWVTRITRDNIDLSKREFTGWI